MSTSTYTWTIMSINETTRSMLVQFQYNGDSKLFSVPVPPASENVSDWIDRYAPRSQWQPTEPITHISIGQTGENNAADPMVPVDLTATASVFNNKLKALIHEVLIEIQESTV